MRTLQPEIPLEIMDNSVKQLLKEATAFADRTDFMNYPQAIIDLFQEFEMLLSIDDTKSPFDKSEEFGAFAYDATVLAEAMSYNRTEHEPIVDDLEIIANYCRSIQTKLKQSMETKDFGWALHQLREGKKVQRAGWNGKGMFLVLIPAKECTSQNCECPDALKQAFPVAVPYGPYIAMKTAQDNVVPWLASQTDVLAEDWDISIP